MHRYRARREFYKHNGKTYPVGSEFHCSNGIIYNIDGLMCNRHSQKSFDCLVGDDDDQWELRASLITEIEQLIICQDLDVRYDRLMFLWNDETAMRYGRGGNPDIDSWLWNDDFYCAEILDLQYLKEKLLQIGR